MLYEQTAHVSAIQVQINTSLLIVLLLNLLKLLLKFSQFDLVFLLGGSPGVLNFSITLMLLFVKLPCRALLLSRPLNLAFTLLFNPLELLGLSLGFLRGLFLSPLHSMLAILFKCLNTFINTLLRLLLVLLLLLFAGLLDIFLTLCGILFENLLPSLTFFL